MSESTQAIGMLMKKFPRFYCSTFSLTLQNLKTWGDTGVFCCCWLDGFWFFLVLWKWFFFFFFLVSRTSNRVEKAILNVVTSLHSNFGAHYLFSWFFFTAPSAAYSICLCLLSTESPFPPLPVCSNCRNSSCAVGLCLRWRYRSSIKHTHTHTAIYLCCL